MFLEAASFWSYCVKKNWKVFSVLCADASLIFFRWYQWCSGRFWSPAVEPSCPGPWSARSVRLLKHPVRSRAFSLLLLTRLEMCDVQDRLSVMMNLMNYFKTISSTLRTCIRLTRLCSGVFLSFFLSFFFILNSSPGTRMKCWHLTDKMALSMKPERKYTIR